VVPNGPRGRARRRAALTGRRAAQRNVQGPRIPDTFADTVEYAAAFAEAVQFELRLGVRETALRWEMALQRQEASARRAGHRNPFPSTVLPQVAATEGLNYFPDALLSPAHMVQRFRAASMFRCSARARKSCARKSRRQGCAPGAGAGAPRSGGRPVRAGRAWCLRSRPGAARPSCTGAHPHPLPPPTHAPAAPTRARAGGQRNRNEQIVQDK